MEDVEQTSVVERLLERAEYVRRVQPLARLSDGGEAGSSGILNLGLDRSRRSARKLSPPVYSQLQKMLITEEVITVDSVAGALGITLIKPK